MSRARASSSSDKWADPSSSTPTAGTSDGATRANTTFRSPGVRGDITNETLGSPHAAIGDRDGITAASPLAVADNRSASGAWDAGAEPASWANATAPGWAATWANASAVPEPELAANSTAPPDV